MIHYHGTPITPEAVFNTLAGRFFCVSFAQPQDVRRAHALGQGVMLDNGAFSVWKKGGSVDWASFYAWVDPWLDFPNTWAVVPDVIDGGTQLQDALLREWPHGKSRAAPVWHMDEPTSRLLALVESGWSRVCVGSTDEYAVVLSPPWRQRMDSVWSELASVFGRTPPIHMLRGMQLSGGVYPFASVDSTDVARNHRRPGNTARRMADRWDSMQAPCRHTPGEVLPVKQNRAAALTKLEIEEMLT